MSYIENNLNQVLSQINSAAESSGRNRDEVKLVAVTKTYGADLINEAIEKGVTDIGENRVQEIMEKYEAVLPVKWHLIGHLQKNKVKYIIDKVELIHSVDSFELAKEIDKHAKKIDKVQNILLEVNVSGEESKFGIRPEECEELCCRISELENVKIQGLMTIAPFVDDKELLEEVFGGLSQLAEKVREKNIPGVSMDELSMGMTNDFSIAIGKGATMVRVGTGIFGKRDYTK
ncbi:MAG: YggS family pyridoxal phosphate-dependent enzyme [Clostridia bacterium]|nr:YggS family pyridoxal phosphate-dependent enzyme [Oscillospiraceae bacterium]MBQ7960515.1 YggS family pyridoxal phosphate-dependent enzyme [Clostridia bacterium]